MWIVVGPHSTGASRGAAKEATLARLAAPSQDEVWFGSVWIRNAQASSGRSPRVRPGLRWQPPACITISSAWNTAARSRSFAAEAPCNLSTSTSSKSAR